MVAQILISSRLDKRKEGIEKVIQINSLKNPHPDLLYYPDQDKLGVETAKKIRLFLSIKPFNALGKIVALESAHNLTPEAQNALLKTIEELPKYSLILLGVDTELNLLPTIISRCQLHFLSDRTKSVVPEEFKEDIKNLLQKSIEERFTYIEKLDKKEDFFKELVLFFQTELRKDSKNIGFAKILLEAEAWQKANVNLRAILEYLMLEMPMR